MISVNSKIINSLKRNNRKLNEICFFFSIFCMRGPAGGKRQNATNSILKSDATTPGLTGLERKFPELNVRLFSCKLIFPERPDSVICKD